MMQIFRQISYEPSIVRFTGGTLPYGTISADSFYVKVMLTQNIDNMGMFTDVEFVDDKVTTPVDYTVLVDKLAPSGFTFPFMIGQLPPAPTQFIDERLVRVVGKYVDDYWVYAGKITGSTDSKITDVRSYNGTQPYITGLDVDKTTYTNYLDNTIDGKTRVTAQDVPMIPYRSTVQSTGTTYVLDADDNINIGTPNQTTGILYTDYSGTSRNVTDEFGITYSIPITNMQFNGEGWNETNTSLSAITKEEYLFGITTPPEVQSDVFIERGTTTVFEKHLRLSEIESLEHLERYNNGFYILVKQ
jgi:hypothetical protein